MPGCQTLPRPAAKAIGGSLAADSHHCKYPAFLTQGTSHCVQANHSSVVDSVQPKNASRVSTTLAKPRHLHLYGCSKPPRGRAKGGVACRCAQEKWTIRRSVARHHRRLAAIPRPATSTVDCSRSSPSGCLVRSATPIHPACEAPVVTSHHPQHSVVQHDTDSPCVRAFSARALDSTLTLRSMRSSNMAAPAAD